MCCLAAGLEGHSIWLLEQILAQSNYRTCWIFGSTSVQILVPFSILFGEYLAIYQTDLDDFQNVPRHLITLEACSLRLATTLIYIWVFVHAGRHKWSKKWKFWWKNDVSQIDRESIWDGPWTFRTSKNIILDGFQAAGPLKKLKKWQTQKVQNFKKNWSIWRLFRPYFLKFPMLAHVLPGRASRDP